MASDASRPASLPPALLARLATSASGFGAVIDGVLNVRTVTDTRNAAALNALCVQGFRVVSTCEDRECDCLVKLMAQLMPTARIVPVRVELDT